MSENIKDIEVRDEPRQEVTVAEILNEVQTDIDSLQDNITKKFQDKRNSILVATQRSNIFVVKNKFLDAWAQKLFAQLISVKLWVIALITVLLSVGLITNIQFASILGLVMAAKGGFDIADVWKHNGFDKNITKV